MNRLIKQMRETYSNLDGELFLVEIFIELLYKTTKSKSCLI